MSIDGWRVEYLSFPVDSDVDGAHTPAPLLFLGAGSSSSTRVPIVAQRLVGLWPIMVVDLPGQGHNPHSCDVHGYRGQAQLLSRFVEHLGVERVIPVGIEDAASVAYSFAVEYAQQCEKLVLTSLSERVSQRLRRLLEAELWCLERGRLDAFAAAYAQHLVNTAEADGLESGVHQTVLTEVHAALANLREDALERHRQALRRKLGEPLRGVPSCETLVYAARFDHHVYPHEARWLAARCPRSRFALLERGDHLVHVEYPDVLAALFLAFTRGAELREVPGLMHAYGMPGAVHERRLSRRRSGGQRLVRLTDSNGQRVFGRLINISDDGCRIEPLSATPPFEQMAPWTLEITPEELVLETVTLAERDGSLRAIFLKTSLEAPVSLRNLLARMPLAS